MASTVRFGPFPRLHFSNRPETVNRLFPQGCVNLGSFPRPFTTHTFRPFTTHSPQNLRPFTTHLHVVRTSRRFTGSKSDWPCGQNPPDQNRIPEGNPQQCGLHKGAVLQPSGPEQAFKGLDVAKWYCRRDSIGNSFVQCLGAPTQYIGSRSICDDMIFMSQAHLLRRFSITSFTQAGVVG